MGKYWNVGMYDRSENGATDSQLRYLKSIYGRDMRGMGLTQGKASDLIEKGLAERADAKSGLTSIADQMFTNYMKRAISAANAAGEAWLAEHKDIQFAVSTPEGLVAVHGPIGYAYITAPKRGSKLAKWLSEHGFNDRRNTKVLSLHHRFTERLEGELQLKCCIAALKVFREALSDIGDIRIVYHCDDENFQLAA
jgi:hypothetical protein|nr:hypothetical protein [Neorhizobium tomejilense]